MVQFLPFAAWRYDLSQVGALSEVTAPAEDIPAADALDELYQRHPCNAIRLTQNREEPGDTGPQDRHSRAADFFQLWKREGILIHEHDAAFYVCQQSAVVDGRERNWLAVIGRLKIAADGERSIIPAAAADPERLAEAAGLLRQTRAQFRPVTGLVLDQEWPGQQEQLFADLPHVVRGLTPLELRDAAGVVHRLWPLTSRAAMDALQQSFAGCRVLLTSGSEQYLAARQWDAELAACRSSRTAHDPSGFVMACLSSSTDVSLSSQPAVLLLSAPAPRTLAGLAERLGPDFDVQRVGDEPGAPQDACELAALHNQQPCLAVGVAEGVWGLVCRRATGNGGTTTAELVTARRQLAAAVQARLTGRAVRAADAAGGTPVSSAQLPDLQLVPTAASVTALLNSVPAAAAILLPALSLAEIAAAAESGQCLPPDSFRLQPAPLAGLLYYSLEH